MQGYILDIKEVNEDDIYVRLLTSKRVKTLYRFYGMRHSYIMIGAKIDFEEEFVSNRLSRLREVHQLSFCWYQNANRFSIYQDFIKLLNSHLKGIGDIDSFYFAMLENASKRIEYENPKRALLDIYVAILNHEGRLHNLDKCYFCLGDFKNSNISLSRAFLPAHTECSISLQFCIHSIKLFFDSLSCIHLDDDDIERLWSVLLKGF